MWGFHVISDGVYSKSKENDTRGVRKDFIKDAMHAFVWSPSQPSFVSSRNGCEGN